ncbi:MAG: preprotein translocase subunit YajC, partial [Parasporobacterium sp.]|nr:preprotein translocase subunit YajC [Parasporobacterium sp.]
MGSGVGADGGNAEGTGSPWYVIVIYIAVFVAFIYFIMIRPQRKQKQKQQDTMSAMEPGDSVLTTSGFYGTIVSVTADTVIVEFGNNKNCRIPMSKQAISQVEKANAATQGAAGAQPASRKKFWQKAKT